MKGQFLKIGNKYINVFEIRSIYICDYPREARVEFKGGGSDLLVRDPDHLEILLTYLDKNS